MYFFLALLWAIVAAMLFIFGWKDPDNPYLQIGNTGISLGWAALVLVLYNLARLWSQRQFRRRPSPPTRPTPTRPVAPPEDEGAPRP